MKEEKKEVALYWDGHAVKSEREIGTISLRFVTVRINESGYEEVRNPSYETESYSDLELHAQWNLDPGCTYQPDCTYGDYAYYKTPFRVGLRDAERMLKMLKRISHVEARFPVRPTTFGQLAVLMCNGLGVKRLCVAETSRGWHNENTHSFYPISEAQRKIDAAICASFPKAKEETTA